MTDTSLIDQPLSDEEMLDPVERAQLELLARMVEILSVMVQQEQILAAKIDEVARVVSAPREIVGTRSDGKPMRALSTVKGMGDG